MDSVTEFFGVLEEFTGINNETDRLWWNMDCKGIFKVSSAYKLLNQGNQQPQQWPWKHIWKVKVSLKVACFTWLLAREAVLTRENLKKSKFSLCSRCYLWWRGWDSPSSISAVQDYMSAMEDFCQPQGYCLGYAKQNHTITPSILKKKWPPFLLSMFQKE